MNQKEIKRQISLHKNEIKFLQNEVSKMEANLQKNICSKYIDDGDYIYLFTDNAVKEKEISDYIHDSYNIEEVDMNIYILETNRGSDKLNMYELYTDDKEEIMEFEMQYDKNCNINVINIDKKSGSTCCQFIKHLVKNIGGKKLFNDKLAEHYNNNFSYNTLHVIKLRVVHIIGDGERKKNGNNKLHDINILSFVQDKNYCKLESGIIRG